MNRNYPGYLISFEGNEGAGKTALVNSVYLWITFGLGIKPIIAREPGGTKVGEQIRELLKDPRNTGIENWTEAFFFQGSRAEISAKVLIPALKEGRIVLLDRFRDSTVAYQGYARGLGCGRVDRLNELSTQGLIPDLTILLDLPVEVGLERKKNSGKFERLDQMGRNFYDDVSYAYRTLASFDDEGRWEVVDANRNYGLVFRDVKLVIEKRLRDHNFLERENSRDIERF